MSIPLLSSILETIVGQVLKIPLPLPCQALSWGRRRAGGDSQLRRMAFLPQPARAGEPPWGESAAALLGLHLQVLSRGKDQRGAGEERGGTLENVIPQLPAWCWLPWGHSPEGKAQGEAHRRGKEKTCCWVGACLHTEFAPGIKLISAGTSNSCPGWPKVCVSHYWDSDRGQSKCP